MAPHQHMYVHATMLSACAGSEAEAGASDLSHTSNSSKIQNSEGVIACSGNQRHCQRHQCFLQVVTDLWMVDRQTSLSHIGQSLVLVSSVERLIL